MSTDTATDADGSGVLVIKRNSSEDCAIANRLQSIRDNRELEWPYGITTNPTKNLTVIEAEGASIDKTSFMQEAVITDAIKRYWNSDGQVTHIVKVKSAAEGESESLAKFWNYKRGYKTGSDKYYLPLQTNFTISSGEIANLPNEVRSGLTSDNLLSRIGLFIIGLDNNGSSFAKNLYDMVTANGGKEFFTVTGNVNNGFKISTRVMLFSLVGSISSGPGAQWAIQFKPDGCGRDSSKDDYFIVEDGKDDGEYKLCMAFAVKTAPNITPETGWYAGHEGNATFAISTAAQLAGLASLVNGGATDFAGKTITLSGVIDLSGLDWTPAGTGGREFRGTLTGGSVLNLSGASPLFGTIGKGGAVRSLTVSGDLHVLENAGLIANTNNGTITNCAAAGAVTGDGELLGGIAGTNNGMIENCLSAAAVTGYGKEAGGVVGKNNGTIRNSSASGAVTGYSYAGGIAGRNYKGIIDNCSSTGEITATAQDKPYSGGIAGFHQDNATGRIADCSWLKNAGGKPEAAFGLGDGDNRNVTNCLGYASSEAAQMPITTAVISADWGEAGGVKADEGGLFTITLTAWPKESANRTVTLSCDGLTFSPASIMADGTPQRVTAAGLADGGGRTVTISANGKEITSFTLFGTSAPSGGTGSSGGCEAGFPLAALALPVLAACLKKRHPLR